MNAIVVGGGLAGILSAAILRDHGAQVTLIEAESELGGLLRSRPFHGAEVDHGTHVPRETGDPAVDDLLFAPMHRDPARWRVIDPIRAGNVLAGQLFDRTEFPNVSALSPARHRDALREMTRLPAVDAPLGDEQQLLDATFGPTATEHIFAPMLEKFLGAEPRALQPGAHRLFTGRVVVGDREEAAALKATSAWNDARFAYHDRSVGRSALRSYYPVAGGIGRWVAALEDDILGGVDVVTGSAAERVHVEDGVARAVTTADGRSYRSELVVWTVGLHPFLRAAGTAGLRGVRPPSLRRTWLTHLAMDRPPVTDLHYVTVFDPAVPAFRVTLYSNLRDVSDPVDDVVTVETLVAPGDPPPRSPEDCLRDLATIGIADPGTELVASEQQLVAQSFPVPTTGLTDLNTTLEDLARRIGGVCFVGRGAGRAFFLADVLREIPGLVTDAIEGAAEIRNAGPRGR